MAETNRQGNLNEKLDHYMKRSLTRRNALRAGGIAALGLVFAKPVINTIRPSPAWAQVSPGLPTPTPTAVPPTATPTPVPTRTSVDASGVRFTPSSVTINVGDIVQWENTSGFHNILADNGSFSSGAPGGAPFTFSHQFNSAGSRNPTKIL